MNDRTRTETNRRDLSKLLLSRDGGGGWRYLSIATEPPGGEPFADGITTHTLHGADNRKAAVRGGRKAAERLGLDTGSVRVLRLTGDGYHLDTA